MHSCIGALTSGQAGTIYKKLIKGEKFVCAHLFVDNIYNRYKDNYENNPSINGRIFEYLICETLAQQKITPFYYQAKFELVPNADFDVVLYHPQNPVVLTMKVSLRERYKQADLEGWALKQVYRCAASYLITMSDGEMASVKSKIKNGAVVGLANVILASNIEYDNLLKELSRKQFSTAEPIAPLQGKLLL